MVGWWMLCALAFAQDPSGRPTPAEEAPATTPAEAPAQPTRTTPDPDCPPAPETGAEQGSAGDLRREARDAKVRDRAVRVVEQRSLGTHPFIPPQHAPSALPTSHLGTKFGAVLVVSSGVDADGDPVNGSYVAVAGGLDGGVRFGKWVGLEVNVAGLAGLAGRTDSLLDLGAQAAWQVGGGLPIRMLQARTTALTLRPRGHHMNLTLVDIQPALDELERQYDAGESSDFQEASRYMLRYIKASGGGLDLALAQSAGSVFGVQIAAGGGLEQLDLTYYDGEEHHVVGAQASVDAGIALSFDFNPVPFAIMLEYAFHADLGLGDLAGPALLEHDVGLGLYLNGLTNTVGLELFAGLGETQIDVGANLAFRAYF